MKPKLLDIVLITTVVILATTDFLLLQEQGFPLFERARTYVAQGRLKFLHLYVPPLPTTPQDPNTARNVRHDRGKTRNGKGYSEGLQSMNGSQWIDEDIQAVQDFIRWSRKQGVRLAGVNKEVNTFYYEGASEKDILPIDRIPNVLNAADGLYELPQPLLKAMQGKTLYLSHLEGRGYTVLGSWPDRGILANVDRGIFIEQPISKLQTIHEFAHILDFHGIQGLYDDENNYWPHLKNPRNEVFDVPFPYDPHRSEPPAGFVDVYSTANSAENFAQHFTYYILRGEEFRSKARKDVLLQAKYDFFKHNLFEGREY